MNQIHNFRLASETFGTSVMKTDEVVLFVKAAVDNGVDLETAYEDMQTIDTLLHIKKLHLAVHGTIKYTRSGNFRKGSTLYDAFNSILEGKVNQDKIRKDETRL